MVVVLGTDFMAEMGFFTVGEVFTFGELVLGIVCNFPEIFFGCLILATLGVLDADVVGWITFLIVWTIFVGLEINRGTNVGLGESLGTFGADFVVWICFLIVGTIFVGLDIN